MAHRVSNLMDALPPAYSETVVPSKMRPFEAEEWQNDTFGVSFDFCPPKATWAATSGNRYSPWHARLLLKTRDLPRLMREGLFWSAGNINVAAGYVMNRMDDTYYIDAGQKFARVYYLCSSEKQHDTGPLWVGKLTVYAQTLRELSHFRPSRDIRSEMTDRVIARNDSNHNEMLYQFNQESPDVNFNTMCEDMPLAGWWPWPKAEGEGESVLVSTATGWGKNNIQ